MGIKVTINNEIRNVTNRLGLRLHDQFDDDAVSNFMFNLLEDYQQEMFRVTENVFYIRDGRILFCVTNTPSSAYVVTKYYPTENMLNASKCQGWLRSSDIDYSNLEQVCDEVYKRFFSEIISVHRMRVSSLMRRVQSELDVTYLHESRYNNDVE